MKVSLVLDKRREKKLGEYPIKYAVTHGGRTTYISTEFSTAERFFNARTGLLRATAVNSKDVNMILLDRLAIYQRAAINLPDDCTVEEARMRILGVSAPQKSFEEVWHEFVYLKPKAERTLATYDYAFGKIKSFAPYLRFGDINYQWLTKFDTWLSSNNLSVDSRHIILHNLRAVCNYACKMEYIDKYPFRNFTIEHGSGTRKNRLVLTEEDVCRLWHYDLSDDKILDWCRNCLMVSFVLGGLNVIDLFGLPSIDDSKIVEYVRHKVAFRSPSSVCLDLSSLPDSVFDWLVGLSADGFIVDHRGRDYVAFENTLKKAMQRLGRRVGIHLSVYSFRYAWATMAAARKVPLHVIDAVQGHSAAQSVSQRYYIVMDKSQVGEALGVVADVLK